MRPLGFEYRSHLDNPSWRNTWDWSLFVSGFLPMLVFGAAIGNALLGIPFYFDDRMVSYYTGDFIDLFNPYAILCGLVAVCLAIYKGGAIILVGSKEPQISQRALRASIFGGVVALILMTIAGFWSANLHGFSILSSPAPGMQQTPLHQTVEIVSGGLLQNYAKYPILWALPGLAYVSLILGMIALKVGRATMGWWLGSITWCSVIGMVGAAMFPFILPSLSAPSHSLTVWNSGASTLTMGWMLGFSLIFIPLIVVYTSWAFYVMRGKIGIKTIKESDEAQY